MPERSVFHALRFFGLAGRRTWATKPVRTKPRSSLSWQGGVAAPRLMLDALEDRTLPSVLPLGPELLVNSYTSDVQATSAASSPAVATSSSGDFVVVWSSRDQDGDGWGVFGQRFDSQGTRQGSEFRANSTTPGDQFDAGVAMASNGDFMVVWASADQDGDGWGVFAQRYRANGDADGGEFQVNSTTLGDQVQPIVQAGANGDFVVAWSSSTPGGDWDIFAQAYRSNGRTQGAEFRVNTTTTGDQSQAALGMGANGDFIVAWKSVDPASGLPELRAQLYTQRGDAQGGEFVVYAGAANDPLTPSVAMDGNGDFVIAWSAASRSGDLNIYASRYEADGSLQDAAFVVNQTLANDQLHPSVAVANNGSFLISWASRDQDGDGLGIFARRFNKFAVGQESEFQVNATTAADQENPTAALANNGRFVIAWSGNGPGDDQGVFVQRFRAGPEVQVQVTADSQTTEAGGTTSLTFVLDTAPTANVVLSLTSSDVTEGTPGAAAIVFTPQNWFQPQTITVTGQNDFVDDGDVSYTIVLADVQSDDPDYQALKVPDVSLSNLDDDTAGVVVAGADSLQTDENGSTDAFTLVLTSEPLADVLLSVGSSDPSEGMTDVGSIVFTPQNWNTPQSVVVTGVDDDAVDGAIAYSVTLGPVESSDVTYSRLDISDPLVAANADNDVPGDNGDGSQTGGSGDPPGGGGDPPGSGGGSDPPDNGGGEPPPPDGGTDNQNSDEESDPLVEVASEPAGAGSSPAPSGSSGGTDGVESGSGVPASNDSESPRVPAPTTEIRGGGSGEEASDASSEPTEAPAQPGPAVRTPLEGELPVPLPDAWTTISRIVDVLVETLSASRQDEPAFRGDLLWARLDALGEQLQSADETVGAVYFAAGVAVVFSAGYVIWNLRQAAWLAGTLTSGLPVWRQYGHFDPLAVVEHWEEELIENSEAGKDGESLQTIVE